MIATVFMAVLVTAVLVFAACTAASHLRAARVIHCTQHEWDAPVPYWPEEALLLTALCPACQDGAGECACTIQCGQLACMGGFSDEDAEFLRALTMPEGTDQ